MKNKKYPKNFWKNKICSVDNCNRIVLCKGYCSKHYYRKKTTGRLWKMFAENGTGHINKRGYRVFNIKGKKISEHRMIMEKHLNRPLEKGEVVHHINGIHGDNRIENLIIMRNYQHASLHHKGKILSKKQKIALRKAGMKGLKSRWG